jgi:hypothetical protein
MAAAALRLWRPIAEAGEGGGRLIAEAGEARWPLGARSRGVRAVVRRAHHEGLIADAGEVAGRFGV